MKRNIVLISALLVISFAFLFAFTPDNATKSSGDFKYVGVDGCTKVCHKSESAGKQLDIWKASKHANAYKSLQTPEADKIAQEKGYSTPAAETPQCVKCHVLGKDIDPAELTDGFKKEDGVQCESCHGPGSEYKAMSIMKDREKAIANGLIIHTDKEKFCTTCHNPESPTYKEFNYDTFWAQIKHYKPAN
jgi:excinuclease UvrABC ATPase subunit